LLFCKSLMKVMARCSLFFLPSSLFLLGTQFVLLGDPSPFFFPTPRFLRTWLAPEFFCSPPGLCCFTRALSCLFAGLSFVDRTTLWFFPPLGQPCVVQKWVSLFFFFDLPACASLVSFLLPSFRPGCFASVHRFVRDLVSDSFGLFFLAAESPFLSGRLLPAHLRTELFFCHGTPYFSRFVFPRFSDCGPLRRFYFISLPVLGHAE